MSSRLAAAHARIGPSFGQTSPVVHAPGRAARFDALLFSLGPLGASDWNPQQWSRNLNVPNPDGLCDVLAQDPCRSARRPATKASDAGSGRCTRRFRLASCSACCGGMGTDAPTPSDVLGGALLAGALAMSAAHLARVRPCQGTPA